MQAVKCQVCGRSIRDRDNVKICRICRLKTYRKIKKQTQKWGRHLARAGAPVSAFSMVFTLTVVTLCVTVATVAGYTYLTPTHLTTGTAITPKITSTSLPLHPGPINEFTLPTTYDAPGEITRGADGNLWFAEIDFGNLGTGKIGRMTPAGVFTQFSTPTANSEIFGIASGSDGNMWFTEPAGQQADGTPISAKIGRITTRGVITEFPLQTANGNPDEITRGPDSDMWFTETGTNKIGRITSNGTITEFSLPTVNNERVGIALGSDGNLWFTEPEIGAIGRITTKGVVTEFSTPSTSQPLAITSGPDGNLWFTEIGAIGRITPKGVITEFHFSTANTQPNSITSGPDGNIWFTEEGRIGYITPKGKIT